MQKIKVVTISFMVVAVLASGVYAGQVYKESPHSQDGLGKRVIKELNLTPEQQNKLEEHRKFHRENMMELHAALKEERAKLREELKKTDFTEATVSPLVEEIKALQAEIVDLRVNGIFAVKAILTPEQFAEFQQMAQKRKEHLKKRFQEWREKKKDHEHE